MRLRERPLPASPQDEGANNEQTVLAGPEANVLYVWEPLWHLHLSKLRSLFCHCSWVRREQENIRTNPVHCRFAGPTTNVRAELTPVFELKL